MEAAAARLTQTQDDIAAIAKAVGYESQSRFTEAFRRGLRRGADGVSQAPLPHGGKRRGLLQLRQMREIDRTTDRVGTDPVRYFGKSFWEAL